MIKRLLFFITWVVYFPFVMGWIIVSFMLGILFFPLVWIITGISIDILLYTFMEFCLKPLEFPEKLIKL
jgi:hypothetical protein